LAHDSRGDGDDDDGADDDGDDVDGHGQHLKSTSRSIGPPKQYFLTSGT
jgi:hypothetical protein